MIPKVLHVLASSHLGGAEQVCLSLAKAQLERGHDVHLLALMRGSVSEAAQKMGIQVTVANIPDALQIGRMVFRSRARESLVRAVGEFHPALVHSHVPLTNLLCNKILPKMHVPWITTVHGSWRQFAYAPVTVNKPYLRPYLLLRHAIGDRITTQSAAKIVAVSDSTRRDLLRVGIDSRKIVTILNGLPIPEDLLSKQDARRKFGVSDDALLIGAMGYLAPVKGFDLLIRAFATLQNRYPKLELWIAGGGVMDDTSAGKSLEQLAARLCPNYRVKFWGTVDPEAGFLSGLDIFVISSRTEGMPLSLLQAMQHGKASVVSNAGGSMEAARPDIEGLLFESGNPQSLASRIEILLGNPELRASLGKAAEQRATTYLTLSRCAVEYDRVYEDVLSTVSSQVTA